MPFLQFVQILLQLWQLLQFVFHLVFPQRSATVPSYSAELQCYSATTLTRSERRTLLQGPQHVEREAVKTSVLLGDHLGSTWITWITGLSTEPKFSESWSRSGSKTFSWHCQPNIFQHLSGVDCSKTAEIFSNQTPGHSSAFHQIYFTQHPPILTHFAQVDLILNFGNFLKFPLNHSNHCLTLSKPIIFTAFSMVFHGFSNIYRGVFRGFSTQIQPLPPWFPPWPPPTRRAPPRTPSPRAKPRRPPRSRCEAPPPGWDGQIPWDNPMGLAQTMVKNRCKIPWFDGKTWKIPMGKLPW